VHYNTFSPQTGTSFANDQKKIKDGTYNTKDQDAFIMMLLPTASQK
jgi:hypothetical protein